MRRRGSTGAVALAAGMLLVLGGCEPAPKTAPAPPPVGHYEGSLTPAGRPALRVVLDIRHPSPGHYEAELSAPTAPALNFVADSVLFGQRQLLLQRPGASTETLKLTLDGDFWRGTLALDSLQAPALLLRRGAPGPSTYHVGELPQATGGTAWLFAPADTGTPGPALALLPDAATSAAAPLWADALAREGVIVLLLPAADSAAADAEAARLRSSLTLLRRSPGADSATVGVWAAGARATVVAASLEQADGPRANFIIAQNVLLNPADKAVFRQLHLPLLGLYGGTGYAVPAATLRWATSRQRGRVLAFRSAGPDLLVPGAFGPAFGPGLPGAVVEWLRER